MQNLGNYCRGRINNEFYDFRDFTIVIVRNFTSNGACWLNLLFDDCLLITLLRRQTDQMRIKTVADSETEAQIALETSLMAAFSARDRFAKRRDWTMSS